MNDTDIIKALECCLGYSCRCPECHFYGEGFYCKETLSKKTLNLINRLKDENERLKGECANCPTLRSKCKIISCLNEQVEDWQRGYCEAKQELKTAKSEARKEFAERVKENFDTYTDDEEWQVLNIKKLVDSLLDEMEKEI